MSSVTNSSFCCICLTHHWVTQISLTTPEKPISILENLQNIVPEVVWSADSKICLQCSELVEKFTEFKKLCIKSSLRQENIKIENSIVDNSGKVAETVRNVAEIGQASEKVIVKPDFTFENSVVSSLVTQESFSDAEAALNDDTLDDDSDYESPKKAVAQKRKKNLSHLCKSCGRSFSKKTELKNHSSKCSSAKVKKMKLRSEKKALEKYHCSFNCQQSFTDFEECQNHQANCQGLFSTNTKRRRVDQSQFLCTKCSQRFTSQEVLTAHFKDCSGTFPTEISEVRTKCPLCNRVFSTKNTFNIHFTTTHRDGDIQNMCQVCLSVFPTAQELTAHVHTPEEVATATQSPQQQQQQCDTCHEVFSSVLELGKHCFTAHDTVWVSDATCEVCLEVFPSDADAVNHYKDAHGIDEATLIRPYLCWHCPARFNYVYFKSHIRYNLKHKTAAPKARNIKEDTKYRCDLCRKICSARNELETHCSKEHGDTEAFQCRHCATRKSTIASLSRHVVSHHINGESTIQNADKPIISCEVCDASFTSPKSVIEHCKTQHNLDQSTVTPYACPHCPRRCVTLATFKAHVSKMYLKEKQRFMCPTCGADFCTKQAAQDHEDGVHKNITRMCELCGRIFKTRPNLQAHMRAHHPELRPVDKQYRCAVHCERSFISKAELQMHYDRINGVKNYTCHACPKTFVRKPDMDAHIRRTHSDVRETFKCEECNQVFKDKWYLKVHMKKAHNLGSVKWVPRCQRPRKHACHLCPKDYSDKRELQRHLDSHAGIKRYTCQFCNSAYAKRENLKSHLLKHHNYVLSASTSFD